MSKQCALLLVTVLFFGFAGFHADAEPLRVVVVTGGHGYEKKAFEDIFIQNTDIACTFYKLQDDSELFEEISDWHYDVIVLYNMSRRISEKRQQNLLQLLDQGVGLVVLHHAIAAFSDWKEYRKIIGARYWLEDMEEDGIAHSASQWKEGVDMQFHVEDPGHPVTRGIEDFTLHDETYKGYDLEPDNHLLLSCSTEGSQQEVAWTRQYLNARICYIQSGHGAESYASPVYRKLVAQAIAWAGSRD